MSKFCIDLEGMMLPDAIAAVIEAWYKAQSLNFSNLAESCNKPLASNSIFAENHAKRHKIINQTIANIKNEILLPGSKMPSIRSLAEMFQCNKNTVLKAYKEMEEKGIIKSSYKYGYYVAQITDQNAI